MWKVSSKILFFILKVSLVVTKFTSFNNFSLFVSGVSEIVEQNFVNVSETIDLISLGGVNASDFSDELLKKLSVHIKVQVQKDIPAKPSTRRKQCSLIVVGGLEDFYDISSKISSKSFYFNGFFLIVNLSGIASQTEEIFKEMWKLQIYNVIVVYENAYKLYTQTFLPFNSERCNDTSPVAMFKGDNKIATKNLFPNKMKNLHGCTIRVSTSTDSKPGVIVSKSPDGSFEFKGSDIDLINAIAKSLNFKISYTDVTSFGFEFADGSYQGALKALQENRADFSVSEWWLVVNRLEYFDSTDSYDSEMSVFAIPPGRQLTSFEKLVYPFSTPVWILILLCFLIGSLIIKIATCRGMTAQTFVFGKGVKNPTLNMFAAFIGDAQTRVPGRNFARFLLMNFLLYSMVMRTLYQASFFKLLNSDVHLKEVQTIQEMIDEGFEFYGANGTQDVFPDQETFR